MPASPAELEAAAALRELGAALVGRHCAEETLGEVAAAARAMAAEVRRGELRDRAARIRSLGANLGAPEIDDLPERPIGGPANPGAVPTVVEWDGKSVLSAEVVIGPEFQGGEGRAHGGVVSGLFDDILSHATTALGVPAVTGRLTIAYQAPTPIGVPVTFQGTVVRADAQRIVVEGEARHGDTLTATAEMIMVVVDEDRFARHEQPEPEALQ